MAVDVDLADGRSARQALDLLYDRWPKQERQQLVREALRSAAVGELSLKHLLIARAPITGRIRGAALAIERPGREAVVWVPGTRAAASREDVVKQLLRKLGERLDEADVACAVCFVDPQQACDRRLLEQAGFPGVADLCLLRSDLVESPRPASGRAAELRWSPWSESSQPEFCDLIERTLRGSLDFPEIGNRRAGSDVLASHRGNHPPAPDLWRLYRRPDDQRRPAAILLLSDRAAPGTLEVQYLGVDPDQRGNGFARRLLADALAVARERRCSTLTVAVESRNIPALRLYGSAGLVETRRYAMHLRVSSDAADSAS